MMADTSTEHPLRLFFMGCVTENAKVKMPKLSPLPTPRSNVTTPHAVSVSVIEAIIRAMNNCMLQGVDIRLHTLLSQSTFPPFMTTRKRTRFRSVHPLLFIEGQTDGYTL